MTDLEPGTDVLGDTTVEGWVSKSCAWSSYDADASATGESELSVACTTKVGGELIGVDSKNTNSVQACGSYTQLTYLMPPKGSKRAPADTSNEPSSAEIASYLHHPRPFKNQDYLRQGTKRNRTVKQILISDREREKVYHEAAREQAQNAMQIDSGQQSIPLEQVFYSNVEAPPSILPPSKYCDITGLDGPYTHPTSGLRYHDQSIYEVVKSLNPSAQQAHLSARGMNSVV